MRITVFFEMGGGGHINDSFNEFSFLKLRMHPVAPLKFSPRQMVAGV